MYFYYKLYLKQAYQAKQAYHKHKYLNSKMKRENTVKVKQQVPYCILQESRPLSAYIK